MYRSRLLVLLHRRSTAVSVSDMAATSGGPLFPILILLIISMFVTLGRGKGAGRLIGHKLRVGGGMGRYTEYSQVRTPYTSDWKDNKTRQWYASRKVSRNPACYTPANPGYRSVPDDVVTRHGRSGPGTTQTATRIRGARGGFPRSAGTSIAGRRPPGSAAAHGAGPTAPTAGSPARAPIQRHTLGGNSCETRVSINS